MIDSLTYIPVSTPRSRTESYLRVLHALMLRDMRTRFGGSHYGYLIVVFWPITHVFLLVAIYTFRHIPAPLGSSAALFFATGALPVLMFQYISREVLKSVGANRPLTYYPQVKMFDVIIARSLVEIVTGFYGLMLTAGILIALGVDPRPADPYMAMWGYLTAILLGIGFGFVNVCIAHFFPAWIFGCMMFNIVIYLTSGVLFLPNYFPEPVYEALKYNPAVQIVEWIRLCYYPELGVRVDYLYTVNCALVFLALGLILERTVMRSRG